MSNNAPPKSAASQKKNSKKKKQRWWQWPWFTSRWSRITLAVAIFAGFGLLIALVNAYFSFSQMIDRKLSGEIFQNTARVYSAPLTLFRGQLIRHTTITDYLVKAHYSEKGRGPGSRVGQYTDSKRSLEILPQEESFYGASDGHVKIDFDEKSIARIVSLPSNNPLDSYEIEPLLITNLFDKNREK